MMLVMAVAAISASAADVIELGTFGKSTKVTEIVKDGKCKYIEIEVRSDYVSYMKISRKNLPQFINAVKETSSKADEWANIARENKTDDVSKKIPVSFPKVDISWKYGGEWFFARDIKPTPYFLYVKSTGGGLWWLQDNVVSSENRFIKNSYDLRFHKVIINGIVESDYAKELLDILDVEKIDKLASEIGNKNDLFK